MEDKKSLNELSKLSKLTERMVDLLESDVSTRRADKAQERKDKIQMSRMPSNRSETEQRHDKDMLSYTRRASEDNAGYNRQDAVRHKESEVSNKSIFTTLKALVGISAAQGVAGMSSNATQLKINQAQEKAALAQEKADARDSKMFHGMVHMAEQNYVTSNIIASEVVKLHSFLRSDSKHELKARLSIMKADRHFDLKREQRLNNLFGKVMEKTGAGIHTQGKLRQKVDEGIPSALISKAMLTLGDHLKEFDQYNEMLAEMAPGGKIANASGAERDLAMAEFIELEQKYGKEFALMNKESQTENRKFVLNLLNKWGFVDEQEPRGEGSKRSVGITDSHEINQIRRQADIEARAQYENLADDPKYKFNLNRKVSDTPLGGMGACCDTLKDIYNEIVKQGGAGGAGGKAAGGAKGKWLGKLIHEGGEKFSGTTESGKEFTGKTKDRPWSREEFGALKGNEEKLTEMFDPEIAKLILDGKVTFNDSSGLLRIKTETGPIDTTDSVANDLAKKELKISTTSEARDVKRARREEEIRRDSKNSISGGVTPFGGSFGRNSFGRNGKEGESDWWEDLDLTDAGVGLLVASEGYDIYKDRKKNNKNKNKDKKPKGRGWKAWLIGTLLGAEVVDSIWGGDDGDTVSKGNLTRKVDGDTGEMIDESTLVDTARNMAWTGLAVHEGFEVARWGTNAFKNRVSSPNFVGPRQPTSNIGSKTAKSVAKRWKELSKKYGESRLKAFIAKKAALLGATAFVPGLGQVLMAIGVLWTAYAIYDYLDEFEKEAAEEDKLSKDTKDTSVQGARDRLSMVMNPEHNSAVSRGVNQGARGYAGKLVAGSPILNGQLNQMQYGAMSLDSKMRKSLGREIPPEMQKLLSDYENNLIKGFDDVTPNADLQDNVNNMFANPGSAYVHDTHTESWLEKIFGVLIKDKDTGKLSQQEKDKKHLNDTLYNADVSTFRNFEFSSNLVHGGSGWQRKEKPQVEKDSQILDVVSKYLKKYYPDDRNDIDLIRHFTTARVVGRPFWKGGLGTMTTAAGAQFDDRNDKNKDDNTANIAGYMGIDIDTAAKAGAFNHSPHDDFLGSIEESDSMNWKTRRKMFGVDKIYDWFQNVNLSKEDVTAFMVTALFGKKAHAAPEGPYQGPGKHPFGKGTPRSSYKFGLWKDLPNSQIDPIRAKLDAQNPHGRFDTAAEHKNAGSNAKASRVKLVAEQVKKNDKFWKDAKSGSDKVMEKQKAELSKYKTKPKPTQLDLFKKFLKSPKGGNPLMLLIPLMMEHWEDLSPSSSIPTDATLKLNNRFKDLSPSAANGQYGSGAPTIINNNTTNTNNNSATDVIFATNAHAPALPSGMVGYGS